MMPNITTGGDTAELVRYLVGPGKRNEHTNPHVVAAHENIEIGWAHYGELNLSDASGLASDLDAIMRRKNVHPEGKQVQWNHETNRLETAGHGGTHVWHCSLSLSSEEGTLDDSKWSAIAQDFVKEMGIATGDPATDCQWVAIRHGKSSNENDHIHIVVNRVQRDGKTWSNLQDMPRSQKAASVIEQRHGLVVLESRVNNRGAIHDSANEYNQARSAGASQTYRAMLESKVRIAATAATSEADFIAQLHAVGLRCRPYFEKGRTDVINGYSVALPSHQIPDGITSEWRAGSKIRKDLGLRVLRTRWEDTPTSATEAAEAWRSVWNSNATQWKQRPLTVGEKTAQVDAAKVFSDRLKNVNPRDPEQLANASADIAGALAAIAENPDAGRVAWQIRSLSKRVAHDAQLNVRSATKDVRIPAATVATRMLLTALASKDENAAAALLVTSVIELVVELSALYRAETRRTRQANSNASPPKPLPT